MIIMRWVHIKEDTIYLDNEINLVFRNTIQTIHFKINDKMKKILIEITIWR